jgi:plastocyanin
MNRKLIRAGLLLGVVAIAAGAFTPAKKVVTIQSMKFNPSTVEINTGDTIRWTNQDDRDHTVASADGSFKSGNLRSGDSFEHTFDKPGKFAYSCLYHPRMKGSVSVSQPK